MIEVHLLELFAEDSLILGRVTADDIRRRVRLYLTLAFAADVGLTPEQLQQFIDGTRTLPRSMLAKLALELVSYHDLACYSRGATPRYSPGALRGWLWGRLLR